MHLYFYFTYINYSYLELNFDLLLYKIEPDLFYISKCDRFELNSQAGRLVSVLKPSISADLRPTKLFPFPSAKSCAALRSSERTSLITSI